MKEFVDPQDFWKYLDSNQHNIRWVSPLTEQGVEVHHKRKPHCESDSPHLNIFVACFTTCWPRLKLYDIMDRLGDRLLYSDTDSIVFLKKVPPTSVPSFPRRLPGRFYQRAASAWGLHRGVLLRWTQELWLSNTPRTRGL